MSPTIKDDYGRDVVMSKMDLTGNDTLYPTYSRDKDIRE